MMYKSLLTLVAASLPLLPAQVNAQVAQGGCEAGTPVANLGFSYAPITITSSSYTIRENVLVNGADFIFREEPRITRVDPKGVSAERVQEGDRIARINGLSVTTSEGTTALMSAAKGRSIVLTLRRGDKLIPVTITPVSTYCPTARQMLPSRAVAATTAPTWNAYGAGATTTGERVALTEIAAAALTPGWLGLGFDCADCSLRATQNGRIWIFSEPPTIYNVDTGSPAYAAGLRRGDVLLRVDGSDVMSTTARTRLGQVKPGENLKLTYRRGGRTNETSLRVAVSPLANPAATTYARAAGQMLKSTQELRASTTESTVRELIAQLEKSRAAQAGYTRELERSIAQGASPAQTRAALDKLRVNLEMTTREQQRLYNEMLRAEQAGTLRLDMVEQELQGVAAVAPQAGAFTGRFNLAADSAVTLRATTRQPSRYSGTVGTANIDVRGPGSVSVQRDGDDLVIVTSDAIIRVTTRKVRDK